MRFPLSRRTRPGGLHPDELVEAHLRELLDVLVPTFRGETVRVDGFRMLNDPEIVHPLYGKEDGRHPESGHPLDLFEPRIRLVQRLLESLLAIVDLESGGQAVPVDAFRLKDLAKWLAPCGGASDILAQAATRCNLRCRFCYNIGAPPALRARARPPDEEFSELAERIERYVPGARLALFPSTGGPCEVLDHPHILEILKRLRERTGEALRIATNGSRLTPEMIEALASSGPVFLDISLNSARPDRRRWLMRDPEPETAIAALSLLREREIPFSVVVVPWPFPTREVMLEDLRETLAFADNSGAALIQVSLPGYSRRFSRRELFSREEIWGELTDCVRAARAELCCPVVIRPGLFEEYRDPGAVDDPSVVGVIPNSPTHRAGLRRGDRLIKIHGLRVKNRPQARSLLTILHESDVDGAVLSVERGGKVLELRVDKGDFGYPYGPETACMLGVVFASAGLPIQWIQNVRRAVEDARAREILLLTSALVAPTLKRRMASAALPSGVRLHIRVPENRYFGGNIFMGDLLVVEDFIAAVDSFLLEGGPRPDLVLIPSSPFHISGWGRDLTGRVYLEIERHTGIRVSLVRCEPIFD